MATDIFLSYAWGPEEKDGRRLLQEKAHWVARHLATHGWTVWLDTHRMAHAATEQGEKAGDLNDAMASGIAMASAVVVCLSPSYASRENTKKELVFAKRRGKPLFFVNVGDPPTPTDSAGWHTGVFADKDAHAVGWLDLAVGDALWADCRSRERAEGPGGLAQLAQSLAGNPKVTRTGPRAASAQKQPPLPAGGGGGGGKEAEEDSTATTTTTATTPSDSKEAECGGKEEEDGCSSPTALAAAVEAAVATMVAAGATPQAALQGAALLCGLAEASEQGRDAAVAAVPALTAVLAVHGSAAAVAECAAHALKNTASGSSAARKAACLPAVPALVEALARHTAHPGCVEQAAGALKNIAAGGAGAASACAATGAVAPLLAALAAHAAAPAPAAALCGALRNLAALGGAPCRAHCRAAVPAITAALLVGVKAGAGGRGLCAQACGALRAVAAQRGGHGSEGEEEQEEEGSSGGGGSGSSSSAGPAAASATAPLPPAAALRACSALAAALGTHAGDADIVCQAGGALWNLLEEALGGGGGGAAALAVFQGRVAACIAAQAPRLLLAALHTHAGAEEAVEQVLGVLGLLTWNSSRHTGTGAGAGAAPSHLQLPVEALPPLLEAWGRHSTASSAVCVQACRVLAHSVAGSSALLLAALAPGAEGRAPQALTLLVHTVRAHSSCPPAVQRALHALLRCSEACSESRHAREHFLAAQAPEALLEVAGSSSSSSSSSCEAACRVLRVLAKDSEAVCARCMGAGAAGVLAGALARQGPASGAASEALASLLSVLCHGSEERKVACMRSGSGAVPRALLAALAAQAASPGAVEACCEALNILCGGSEERREQFMALAAPAALAAALRAQVGGAAAAAALRSSGAAGAACESACTAVALLGWSREAPKLAALVATGVVPLLVRVLCVAGQVGSSSGGVGGGVGWGGAAEKASLALLVLARQHKAQLVAEGAVPALAAVARAQWAGEGCRQNAQRALEGLGCSDTGAPLPGKRR